MMKHLLLKNQSLLDLLIKLDLEKSKLANFFVDLEVAFLGAEGNGDATRDQEVGDSEDA